MYWTSVIVKKAERVGFLLMVLLLVFSASEAGALNRILNVRHWVAPDHTRIVIDTSEAPDIHFEKGDNRVRIDFKDTAFPKNLPQKTQFNKPGLASIVIERLPEKLVRIDIFLSDHVAAAVFKLPKFDEKPDRVVVDIELPEVEKKETQEREQIKTVKRKDRIVVIDPGHGGDDPGAIGWARTQEKNVVLQIARKLRDNLNQREGYRAFLTRNGDYYVPFNKRLKIAREYGADLFLSIHADAARSRRAQGTSVYCLSTGGATTEAARLLARKENLADVMGGSPNGESNDASDPIVLNMYQTNTINTSKTYGQCMLKHMEPVIPLKYSAVQGAPFRVLKLPDIPSLLVETAYISNKKEEKLLRSDRHQTKIADALAKAVVEILPAESGKKTAPEIVLTRAEPQPGPEEAISGNSEAEPKPRRKETLSESDEEPKPHQIAAIAENRVKPKSRRKEKIAEKADTEKQAVAENKADAKVPRTQIYKVEWGDTLDKIAKKNNMGLAELLKLNNLKLKNPIYGGQKLKITLRDQGSRDGAAAPASRKSSAKTKKQRDATTVHAEPAVYAYRVKEGDTLEKIALKHDITLGALLKRNGMNLKDPLYAGRMIKIKDKPVQKVTRTVAKKGVSKKIKKEKYAYYKVKKGETLDIIARRNGMTISELRQLNRMKRSDPLWADRKLKLPLQSSL
jgi:N-acetylmuramoyl-L-alanine amidase